MSIEREAAKQSFDAFTLGKKLNANQIEFINLIVDHVRQRGWMEPSFLYESPFTDFRPRVGEGVFNSAEVHGRVSSQRFPPGHFRNGRARVLIDP